MSRLGTRDLYESIERDRRRRHLRNQLCIFAAAAVVLAGMYGASLGLAHALDTVHRLFTF